MLFFSRAESRGLCQRRKRIGGCPDPHSFSRRGFLAPDVINEAQVNLTDDEYQLLKLGARFIYNDPKTAPRRCATELATLKRQIEKCFFEQKVSSGYALELFINELDILVQNFHMKSMGKSHGHPQQQEARHSKISKNR